MNKERLGTIHELVLVPMLSGLITFIWFSDYQWFAMFMIIWIIFTIAGRQANYLGY